MDQNDKYAGAKGFFGDFLTRFRRIGEAFSSVWAILCGVSRNLPRNVLVLQVLQDFFLDIFLNAIFPRGKVAAEIEGMNKADFAKAVFGKSAAQAIATRIAMSGTKLETYAIFPYRNHYVRTAIWQVKYKGNRTIAALLGEFLNDALKDIQKNVRAKIQTDVMIIPMPISAQRRKERGYNQIELILGKISSGPSASKIIRTDILHKIKHTPSQTLAESRTKRLLSLSGCFSVARQADVQNKTVILVDDVLTTGATVTEAGKTLLEAGAKRVITITIAH